MDSTKPEESSEEHTMRKCYFLLLPLELRQQIYLEVLDLGSSTGELYHDSWVNSIPYDRPGTPSTSSPMSLSQVNQQIHNEVLSFFYSKIRWDIYLYTDFTLPRPHTWTQGLPYIHTIELSVYIHKQMYEEIGSPDIDEPFRHLFGCWLYRSKIPKGQGLGRMRKDIERISETMAIMPNLRTVIVNWHECDVNRRHDQCLSGYNPWDDVPTRNPIGEESGLEIHRDESSTWFDHPYCPIFSMTTDLRLKYYWHCVSKARKSIDWLLEPLVALPSTCSIKHGNISMDFESRCSENKWHALELAFSQSSDEVIKRHNEKEFPAGNT